MKREPGSLVAGSAGVVAGADHRPLVVDPFAAVVAVSLFFLNIIILVYLEISTTLKNILKLLKKTTSVYFYTLYLTNFFLYFFIKNSKLKQLFALV